MPPRCFDQCHSKQRAHSEYGRVSWPSYTSALITCDKQYSEAISKYAEDKFLHDGVNLITNARVAAVTPEAVVYTTRTKDGKTESHEIPTNFVLWSTGIAMNPFTARVSSLLYVVFNSFRYYDIDICTAQIKSTRRRLKSTLICV